MGSFKGTLKGTLKGSLRGTLRGTLKGTLRGTLKCTFRLRTPISGRTARTDAGIANAPPAAAIAAQPTWDELGWVVEVLGR